MRVMDHALSAVETVAFMVSKFTSFQSNPMLGFVVAELSTNIDSLFGESYRRIRVLSDWCSTADEQTKVRAQNDATLISLHLKTIKDVNKESLRANFESAQEKDNTEKAKENYDRLAKQRVRDGVNFLNDVERDKDYLSTPVYPTAVDLTAPPPLALPQNIVSDVILNDGDEYKSLQRSTACAYRSTHHYLNTHYLLIRETCLAQLRRGVSAFRELLSGESQVETIDKPSPKDLDHACKQFLLLRGNDVAYIYGHVAVHGVDRMHDGIGYVVSFQMFDSRKIDWKNTSRFMNGSLLCLSSDGTFNTTSIVVATILRGVQQPTGSLKNWIPTVTITIDKSSIGRFDPNQVYTMVESIVYFDASRPVLHALQQFGEKRDLPFQDVLLGRSNNMKIPSYLLERPAVALGSKGKSYLSNPTPTPVIEKRGWDLSAVFPSIRTPIWDATDGSIPFPDLPADPPLDVSQREAIKLALTQEIAIIQGPPGTGKTFVGVLISKLLIANRHLRAPKPVLFICQTNHALDQMLEHIYKFEQNIIRIGGRSESLTMQTLGIADARKKLQSRITRTVEERQALGMMQNSLLALKSSLAQSKIFGGDGTAPFPNSTLARLKFILDSVDDGSAGAAIASIVQSSNKNLQRAAWESCYKAARVREKNCSGWLDDNRSDSFREWCEMDTDTQMILMATHTPDCSSSDVALHIMDSWRMTAPPRRAKKIVTDADGYQEVSSKRFVPVSGFDDDSDCDLIQQPEGDTEKIFGDDDAINELLRRDLEIPDFEPDEEVASDRRLSDKEVIEDLTKRRVPKISSVLISQVMGAHSKYRSSGLQDLSLKERAAMVSCWAKLLKLDADSSVTKYTENYKSASDIDMEYQAKVDTLILKSAAAIGMTTNGAAKYNRLIRALQPEVVVVEEAAAVLESSIIASFSNSTKHVILIGDHIQLRPTVSEYNLRIHNRLDVSLFERLIRMNCRYVRLTTQRRMHPEICELITPSIYSTLHNAPSVSEYPPVSGVKERLYFINHTVPEDGQAGPIGLDDSGNMKLSGKAKLVSVMDLEEAERSKTNSHEVTFAPKNGSVGLLSMYKGQLMLLRRLVNEAMIGASAHVLTLTGESMSDVRMTTTDNYQGEESDIVLMSLVRSNQKKQAGFVKEKNRVCVALSRARHGMYVIGDLEMMSGVSDLWKVICDVTKTRNRFTDHLPLQCPKHALVVVEARSAPDFLKCPNGGCTRMCGDYLKCGHQCMLLCHPLSHDMIRCTQPCLKPRPANCAHKCLKPCFDICGPCMIPVRKYRIKCDHTNSVACSADVEDEICKCKCGVSMLCGHLCEKPCTDSGHDALRHLCYKKCDRTPLCGHPCKKQCFESCGSCLVEVQRTLSCGHPIKAVCSMDVSTLVCKSVCRKPLSCGHPCSKECGHNSPCDEDCLIMVEKTLLMCRKVPHHFLTVPCHLDITAAPCQTPCLQLLSCGHICSGTCNECESPYVDQGYSIPQHKECGSRCMKILDCNHKCIGDHLCRDSKVCPPCMKPCNARCPHGSCKLLCGEPCVPCTQSCTYNCSHVRCIALCSEPHSCIPCKRRYAAFNLPADTIPEARVDLCFMKCPKTLNCGHPCRGVCGEKCPLVCAICNPLDKILQYHHQTASFIQLECGHSFELNSLDAAVADTPINKVPACPTCGKNVGGAHRYSFMVSQKLKSLEIDHLHAQEKKLLNDVMEDMEGKEPLSVIKESLLMTLTAKPRNLHPVTYLLLGKVSLQMGSLKDAETNYIRACNDPNGSSWIRREAFTSLGYLHLSNGKLGGISNIIENTSAEKLKICLNCFNSASRATANDDVDILLSTGRFSAPEDLIFTIQEKLHRLSAEKELAKLQRTEMLAAPRISIAQSVTGTTVPPGPARGTHFPHIPSLFPPAPTPIPIRAQMLSSGGSVLHREAVRGNLKEVQQLVEGNYDTSLKDDLGNTALLCAAENGHLSTVLYLMEHSPWHSVNKAKKSFLDTLSSGQQPVNNTDINSLESIFDRAREHLADNEADPSRLWAAAKHFEGRSCLALDKLMDMIGLRTVKLDALKLYLTICGDMERPLESRVTTKLALNFLFLGNPGTGKTTVARLFGEILSELKIREDVFKETSGQKLLQQGSSKFPALLQSVTPGILFIDEIYQLDPQSNGDGRAITNNIMEATENDRDKLTVIVAGYRNDVMDKWASSNPGILSRFPSVIIFEDFSEKELRTIFINIAKDSNWQLEPFQIQDRPSVDVAEIAARRLRRAAGRDGFANARAVRVLFEKMQKAASIRQKKESQSSRERLPLKHSTTLTLIDLIGAPIDFSNSPMIHSLMELTGLEDVKDSIRALMKVIDMNYQSELRGEKLIDITLHRMFLGNPGTGKTTVAKLYGEILVTMGFLSNGEVIVTGASKLIGGVVGSTSGIVNKLIDSVKGKVLVIDEAYILADSIYGREALDTLVERVQGTFGEDFAVILCGYEEKMRTMLRDCNPGLSRRFRSEDAFKFADYNDSQLISIMMQRAAIAGFHITEQLASSCVTNVLAKQRAKPNFGNVGAINNLLQSATEKMMRRDSQCKIDGLHVLEEEDMFNAPDPDAAIRVLEHLVNADEIIQHTKNLKKRITMMQKRGGDPKTLLKNYSFVGSPGTGKTTVARAFGEIFHNLGLLNSSDVVECKAMDLLGEYVGQSAPKVNEIMNKARGGVLFIDEAYGLKPTTNSYANECLLALLANLTDPKYVGNMLVIIAGYSNDIRILMDSNPGMTSRFTEQLEFKDWDCTHCLDLLKRYCREDSIELPEVLHKSILEKFTDLIGRDGWGNARDVNTVREKMHSCRDLRCDDDGDIEGGYTRGDIDNAFHEMMKQRSNKRDLPMKNSIGVPPVDHKRGSFPQQTAKNNDARQEVTVHKAVIEEEENQNNNEMAENDIDPEALWSSLDEALGEKGYTVYQTAQILQGGKLPTDLVELVAMKVSSSVARVRPMLEAQCPLLLPKVLLLIETIRRQLELQRLAQEEIERADEVQRVLLKEKERIRQAEALMERVQMIGRCCMGFAWIKCSGGYRCAGGSHFVSDSMVNKV